MTNRLDVALPNSRSDYPHDQQQIAPAFSRQTGAPSAPSTEEPTGPTVISSVLYPETYGGSKHPKPELLLPKPVKIPPKGTSACHIRSTV